MGLSYVRIATLGQPHGSGWVAGSSPAMTVESSETSG